MKERKRDMKERDRNFKRTLKYNNNMAKSEIKHCFALIFLIEREEEI
jgi:hypothetical protein